MKMKEENLKVFTSRGGPLSFTQRLRWGMHKLFSRPAGFVGASVAITGSLTALTLNRAEKRRKRKLRGMYILMFKTLIQICNSYYMLNLFFFIVSWIVK